MRNNKKTIRFELIIAVIESGVLAVVCMLFLGVLMIWASTNKAFAEFFIRNIFLFILIFLVIFVTLICLFFLFIIRNHINYVEEITKTLDTISNDSLDVAIPIKTSDELGKMAETVNNMAYKLRMSIEEERRAEKNKNDLITNMSHDLRTPLTSMLGYLELIKNTKIEDEGSLKKYIGIAYDKCRDLKVLIDDLFEYSKLNNPGMTINKTRISIGELLEQVVLSFIPALKAAGMEYRLSFCNEKLFVNADPILLTRVFNNLINNAMKYGRDGKYLDIELLKEDNTAAIRVINYGKRIPNCDLPYIFEKFYQAHNSRSTEGSGLGLAIVKRILEMHDGTITAASDDKKTVFEVKLIVLN